MTQRYCVPTHETADRTRDEVVPPVSLVSFHVFPSSEYCHRYDIELVPTVGTFVTFALIVPPYTVFPEIVAFTADTVLFAIGPYATLVDEAIS